MDRFSPILPTTNMCYNIGAALDIINPLMHTNCKKLICIDIPDYSFEHNLQHLPILVAYLYFEKQTRQKMLSSRFTKFKLISITNNKFVVNVEYDGIMREIIYYSSDEYNGNIFTPTEIMEEPILDSLWISMSDVTKETILRLKPKNVIVFNTRGTHYDCNNSHKRIHKSIRIGDIIGDTICVYNVAYEVYSD